MTLRILAVMNCPGMADLSSQATEVCLMYRPPVRPLILPQDKHGVQLQLRVHELHSQRIAESLAEPQPP